MLEVTKNDMLRNQTKSLQHLEGIDESLKVLAYAMSQKNFLYELKLMFNINEYMDLINIANQIWQWNIDREAVFIELQLEEKLINEELTELKLAKKENDIVACYDAIADCIYILIGMIYRNVFYISDNEKLIKSAIEELKELSRGFDINIIPILHIVHKANCQKTKEKNSNGKITKPAGFIPPETKIKEYLGSI